MCSAFGSLLKPMSVTKQGMAGCITIPNNIIIARRESSECILSVLCGGTFLFLF